MRLDASGSAAGFLLPDLRWPLNAPLQGTINELQLDVYKVAGRLLQAVAHCIP